jgi:hydrophobic/amphiphilic exporter-1 (mainly G- bacteria), HAE1 family
VDDIRKLIVNPQSERPVPLSAVAEVVETTGPSEIHRVDQVRVAIVSANLRDIDLGTAVARSRAMVAERPAGTAPTCACTSAARARSWRRRSLAAVRARLAIFLVYLVMASQFESLLHPFVILFTIPLALVGAVLALLLLTGIADLGGGVHRPDPAGRHRGEERDRADRQGQPAARAGRAQARGAGRGRARACGRS